MALQYEPFKNGTLFALSCLLFSSRFDIGAANPVPAPHVITPEEMLGVPHSGGARSASAFRASNSLTWLDDETLIYSDGVKSVGEEAKVFALNTANGQRAFVARCDGPTVSPDKSTLACVKEPRRRTSGHRLVTFTARSGRGLDARRLDPAAGTPVELVWSPDGSTIAIISERRDVEAKASQSDYVDRRLAMIAETSEIEVFGAHRTEQWPARAITVSLYSLRAKQVRQVRLEGTRTVSSVQHLRWSRDGTSLVGGWNFDRWDRFKVQVASLDVVSGVFSEIPGAPENLPPHSEVLRSPSGNEYAVEQNITDAWWPHLLQLQLRQGPEALVLAEDKVTGNPRWSEDGRQLYFTEADEPLTTHIFVSDQKGHVRQMTFGDAYDGPPVVSPDARHVVWIRSGYRGDYRLMRADGDFSNIVEIASMVEPGQGFQVGRVRRIVWNDSDGTRIGGLLYTNGSDSGRAGHPLLVDIHGGPLNGLNQYGPVLLDTPLERDYWVSLGFDVFVPDYRSSSQSGFTAILNARRNVSWAENDADDVVTGIQAVLGLGHVDPNNVALIGHSAGGAIVNWLVTHQSPYAAAISYESASTGSLQWGNRWLRNSAAEWLFQGSPDAARDRYDREDVTRAASANSTPTLFINAERGINSPEQEFLYAAAAKRGVDVQFVFYRNEGHVISAPAGRRDVFYRTRAWILDHCKGNEYCDRVP